MGIEDLVRLLGEHTPIPVTYAGGASSIADLEHVRVLGRGRVDLTIGSALDLFGGALPYTEVVAWHRGQQQPSDTSWRRAAAVASIAAVGFGCSARSREAREFPK